MARILITVPPLVGHLNPALAVAAELTERGHEVAWAVHVDPLGPKLPPVARVFALDTVGGVVGIDAPRVRGLESVRLFFEDYTLPMAHQVMAPLEAAVETFEPDVLVVDHQMPAGALVARRVGLPWVSLVTTSASILKLSPMLDAWVTEQYADLQARYLPADERVARPDVSPHALIVFSIEALLPPDQPRLEAPTYFVGPTRGQGRQHQDFPWAWFKPHTRKLLITLGTVSRDRDTRFFEVMMTALAGREDIQAVMVAPEALAEQAPPNVLVRAFVPQLALLDQVDAVICHAGHNTVCESLLHGKPMILAPIRDDQPVIARQVIDAGAGLFLRFGKVTPNMARQAIDTLLSEEAYARAAQHLGEILQRHEGASTAADLILAQSAVTVRSCA